MQVKTFNDAGLHRAARELNALVFRDFVPDIMIGIRTGGFVVAEIMAREAAHKPLLLAISKQRASTKQKSAIKDILRHLPYFITNILRVVEHYILNSKPAKEPENFTPNAEELAALQSILRLRGNAKILIIDDAVDSGATMKAVRDLVRREAGAGATVKTAAVTVTTKTPLIQPDYALYHHVLCRFYWAFDFHG